MICSAALMGGHGHVAIGVEWATVAAIAGGVYGLWIHPVCPLPVFPEPQAPDARPHVVRVLGEVTRVA